MDKGGKNFGVFVAHVFLPFLSGFVIYILWRPTNLLFFHWIDSVGYFPLISLFRDQASPIMPFLPYWFLDSLPAALFLYALTSWFQIVWKDCYGKEWLAWIAIALLTGVASEIGQYFQFLSGNFDSVDVIFYVVAWMLGLYIPKGKESKCL